MQEQRKTILKDYKSDHNKSDTTTTTTTTTRSHNKTSETILSLFQSSSASCSCFCSYTKYTTKKTQSFSYTTTQAKVEITHKPNVANKRCRLRRPRLLGLCEFWGRIIYSIDQMQSFQLRLKGPTGVQCALGKVADILLWAFPWDTDQLPVSPSCH